MPCSFETIPFSEAQISLNKKLHGWEKNNRSAFVDGNGNCLIYSTIKGLITNGSLPGEIPQDHFRNMLADTIEAKYNEGELWDFSTIKSFFDPEREQPSIKTIDDVILHTRTNGRHLNLFHIHMIAIMLQQRIVIIKEDVVENVLEIIFYGQGKKNIFIGNTHGHYDGAILGTSTQKILTELILKGYKGVRININTNSVVTSRNYTL